MLVYFGELVDVSVGFLYTYTVLSYGNPLNSSSTLNFEITRGVGGL
jgi:hypothetical protein